MQVHYSTNCLTKLSKYALYHCTSRERVITKSHEAALILRHHDNADPMTTSCHGNAVILMIPLWNYTATIFYVLLKC